MARSALLHLPLLYLRKTRQVVHTLHLKNELSFLSMVVFTLATWQKPIAQETALFASAPQDGEYLFDDNQQRQAHQYKDAAFANLQQNLDLWTINFMNLTAFFKAVLQ